MKTCNPFLPGVSLSVKKLKILIISKVVVMKKIYSLWLLISIFNLLQGQDMSQISFNERKARIDTLIIYNYQCLESFFQEAYQQYPTIPRGILEAVAYAHSRFVHLQPNEKELSTESVPAAYSVMGLVRDGKGCFKENLKFVSEISGIRIEKIIQSPREAIWAYAAAYAYLQRQYQVDTDHFLAQVPILRKLSEIPDQSEFQFAQECDLYEIARFINQKKYREKMQISLSPVPMEDVFGERLPLLEGQNVQLYMEDTLALGANPSHCKERGWEETNCRGVDYAGARWVAAGSCNYSSRNGIAISSVAIHYTQGTYAGSIAWFQNCTYNGHGSQVSAHYVIRSSDGQITQMVRESEKAWHVGSANGYTIGIEHEAYGDIASYFTPEMYASSANLTRDICQRNNISTHRVFYRDTLDDGTVLNAGLHSLGGANACTKIRGHQHYPSQSHTDPGPYWDWNYYYKLINNHTPVITLSNASGTFTDSGGAEGNYSNDERKLYLIQVENAERIQLSFSEFDLEADYDFMWIYDGSSVFSPLIGRWNTHSPNEITSSGNVLLVEFRSDCATTASGWIAQWQAIFSEIQEHPSSHIQMNENEWISEDIEVSFSDIASAPIAYRFYQIMGNDGIRWTANSQKGFLVDNFDDLDWEKWTPISGNWNKIQNKLHQSANGEAVLYTPLNVSNRGAVLYDFYATYLPNNQNNTGGFGVLFHADNITNNSRITAYQLLISPSEHRINLCKVSRGTITLLCSFSDIYTQPNVQYFYRIIHDISQGLFLCYRNGVLVGQGRDSPPIISNGQQFAFITSATGASFDNVRTYKSRNESVYVSVGEGWNDEAQWQARDGIAKTKIKTIITDIHGLCSSLNEKLMKIDYTPPMLFGKVSDGLGPDIDYTNSNLIAAHWPQAVDPNSGISFYYCYLRNPRLGNGVEWCKPNMTIDTTSLRTYPLEKNTLYYAEVKAMNGAGLSSSSIFSDGFVYRPKSLFTPKNVTKEISEADILIYPNPSSDKIRVQFIPKESQNGEQGENGCQQLEIKIFNVLGELVFSESFNENDYEINISDLLSGIYILYLYSEHVFIGREKFIKYD